MSFETDITEIRKICELMGRVDKDEVARHLWGKPYNELTDEQKALLDTPVALAEATPGRKSMFKAASDANIAARPVAKRHMYYFKLTISAEGISPDEAWQDAVDSFCGDPGFYDEYTTEDVPE